MKKNLKNFFIIIFFLLLGFFVRQGLIFGLEGEEKIDCHKWQSLVKEEIRKDLFNPSAEMKFRCGQLGVRIDDSPTPRGEKEVSI